MQRKTMIYAAGMFVTGAVFGWAVTADKAERDKKQMLEAFEELMEERDADWFALLSDKTEQIFALKHEVAAAEVKDEQKPIPRFRDARLLGPEEVQKHLEEAEEHEAAIEFISNIVEGENPPEDLTGEDPGDAEVDDNDFEEPILHETPEETRSNLQSLIDRYIPTPAEEAFMKQVAQAQEADLRPPFVISRDEFSYGEEGEHFTKATIFYYERERMLLDDDEDPVEDVNGLVGWKNLGRFGDESHDPDVVFIRNPKMQMDFEVIREDKTLPVHVRYAMDRTTFESRRAAGLLKLRPEDQ